MEEKNNNINDDLLADVPEEYVSGGKYREKLESFKPNRPEQITWKQKIAVAFLILFGISAIFLWAIQFKNGLQTGQRLAQNKPAGNSETRTEEQIAVEESRDKDTDEDGLSDYEEINYHKTSRFLEDTDSDGLSDKKELELGEDPNCPLGRDCSVNNSTASSTESAISNQNSLEKKPALDVEGINNYLQESETGGSADLERQAMEKILEGSADANTLRSLLLQAGVDENMLNQISDEQLLNIYNQTLTSPNP